MLIICRRNSDRQYRHNNVRKRGTITKSSISVFLVVSKRNAMFLHPISKECLESSTKQATRLNSPQWNRLSLLVQPFSLWIAPAVHSRNTHKLGIITGLTKKVLTNNRLIWGNCAHQVDYHRIWTLKFRTVC